MNSYLNTFSIILVGLVFSLFFNRFVFAQDAQLYERLEKLERTMSTAGLIDLVEQLEALQAEMRFLRGQIEQLEFEMKKITLGQGIAQDKVNTFDNELPNVDEPREMEMDGGDNIVDADKKESLPSATGLGGSVVRDSALSLPVIDVENSYREAFSLLKEGKYQEAIEGFNNYLSTNPNGKYSDNSQFWLGEAYYVIQKYNMAIRQYSKLIQDFPESKKSSHALLKIGYCHEKLGDADKAVETLKDLSRQFPDSAAARLGRTKIEKLTSD